MKDINIKRKLLLAMLIDKNENQVEGINKDEYQHQVIKMGKNILQ